MFQDVNKEVLSQIRGIGRREALTPDKGVNGRPVNLAQSVQGVAGVRGLGSDDERPKRRFESGMCGLRLWR